MSFIKMTLYPPTTNALSVSLDANTIVGVAEVALLNNVIYTVITQDHGVKTNVIETLDWVVDAILRARGQR